MDNLAAGKNLDHVIAYSLSLAERDFSAAQLHKTAIRTDTLSWSFAEVQARVNALAAYLLQQTRAGEVVALLGRRSPLLLLAQMACLQAGRPFLLPPAVQGEELGSLLQQAQTALVLTAGQVENPLPVLPCLHLEAFDFAVGLPPGTRINAEPALHSGQALAYIIYTSGSTGRPKAIAVSRRGLANYCAWAARYYRLSGLEGALAQLNPSFDASLTQLVLPLLEACTVYLIAPGQEIEGTVAALRQLEQSQPAQGRWLLKVTPSQLPALEIEARTQGCASFAGLQGELVVGGEALLANHVQVARRLLPQFLLHNEYGPSETVVGCLIYTLPASAPVPPAVPIGQVIDHTRIWVLNEQGQMCKSGEAGMLYIGGAGVAHGYLQSRAQTASAFLPAPDSMPGMLGARMYCSGDLVQMDQQGQLHYLGRRDGQLKLRGFRVELGEIQARLEQVAGVEQVALQTRPDADGNLQLLAWLRLQPAYSMREVQQTANARLPAHMLPQSWYQVQEMPLNANGKTDLAALLAQVENNAPATAAAKQEPGAGSAQVEKLRAIWAAILQHQEFADDQSFFAVGGHSILAVKLRAALRKQLGWEIPLAKLLELPSIKDQAAALAAAQGAAVENKVENKLENKVETVPERAAALPGTDAAHSNFPLSLYQESMWLAIAKARQQGARDPYTVAAAVHIRGDLQLARLQQALQQVMSRHGVLYTRFVAENGEMRQYVGENRAQDARWRYQVEAVQADLDTARAHVQALAAQEFDLEQGPLLRLHLLPLAAGGYLMLWQAHHLILDQWTMQLLVQQTLAACAGQDLGPAPAWCAYGQFSAAQRAAAQKWDSQLAWWQEQLQTGPATRGLPRLRAQAETFAVSRLRLELPPQLVKHLQQLARREAVTMNALAYAMLACALGLGAQLPLLRMSTPLAVRAEPGLENVAGYFLNSLPLQLALDPQASLLAHVHQAQQQVQSLLAHQDLPYARLCAAVPELLQPEVVHGRYVFLTSRLQEETALMEQLGCEVEEMALAPTDAQKFELMISAVAGADSLAYCFDYNPQVYAAADMAAWSAQLKLIAARLHSACDSTLAGCKVQALSANPASARVPLLAKRKVVNLAAQAEEAVRFSQPAALRGAQLIQAMQPGLDLRQWVQTQRAVLDQHLLQYGALLLRGFAPYDTEGFAAIVKALADAAPAAYENRSTPRTQVGDNIFTSTEYPASETIPLHNENAYSHRWPGKLVFCCQIPATSGGATPIADNRKVTAAISNATREEFARRGVRYVRNYGSAGLSWQETFQTEDKQQVQAYCAANDILCEWQGEHLRTSQITPALRRHPHSGEWLWFNQAHLFHVSSLGAAAADLLTVYGEENLPRHATFGDGGSIPAAMLEEIRAAYAACSVPLEWQAGDLALLDNMLYVHGRAPYAGERKVLVGLLNMMDGGAADGA